MSIEEYRANLKDNYIAADVVCPHCGKTFKKHGAYYCPECLVKIFDRDKNGWVTLIDPNTVDKSRTYKVTGSQEKGSEHYPGELVTVTVPFLTDCNFNITADGAELSFKAEKGQLTACFLMPEHDVIIEKNCVNNMIHHQTSNGMDGLGSV